MVRETPNLDSDVTESAIKILLYVKLQIATIIIGIPSYKIRGNMSARHKKHAIVASVLAKHGF
jgi:hypothetical protein